jgi:hypothetical protein
MPSDHALTFGRDTALHREREHSSGATKRPKLERPRQKLGADSMTIAEVLERRFSRG